MEALKRQGGTSMIEVLVTLVIVAIGLLGLAGLQSRLQISELEAYQRAQALVLLSDMANRITTNRPGAADYVTGVVTPIADDGDCPGVSNPPTRQELDMVQWCYRLLGAAEVAGGVRAGAMIGARGCVEPLGAGVFMVTVAWQGLAPISAPPASVACGAGSYDAVGAGCADDLCRRAVTTVVSIAAL